MIPIKPFVNPEKGSRYYNAVKKAVKEKPAVLRIDSRLFRVRDYDLRLWTDADGEEFIECNCKAGAPTPGLDPERTYEPVPCYHCASVLLFIAEKEKEDGIHAP